MKTLVTVLAMMMCFGTVFAADTLTIIHINDTHSNLAPGGRRDQNLHGTVGGIARAASVIGSVKASEKNVLTLHAGDLFIGDLFFQKYYGVAELQLMAMIGFDAMTVGNHEFDLTPFVLQQALDTAFKAGQPFPLLSANTILSNDSVAGLRPYIRPLTVLTVHGIRVGVFGLTTPSTNILSLPAPAIIDTNIVPIAMQMVDSLKKLQCQVIICLSHLGVTYDKAVGENVAGIDLIVGGHDHYSFSEPVMADNTISGKKVPIVQAGSFYRSVGKVQLLVSSNGVSYLNNTIIPLDSSIPEEPSVKGVVDNLVADIEATYGKVYTEKIAEADEDFDEVADNLLAPGSHDTPIGNLVSDAYRTFGKTEIGLQPGGASAQVLFKGPIVAADAFRINGYGYNTENGLGYRMATCMLTGQDIITGLEFGLATIEENDEYLLQCSGMRYSYDPTAAPLNRVHSVEINGSPLVADRKYSVTINEFVVGFLAFVNITPTDVALHHDSTEYHVMATYMMQNPALKAKREGRVRAETTTEVTTPSSVKNEILTLSPNPAHDKAELRFTMSKAAHVRIVMYDSQLREVRCAYDGLLEAGEQRLPIDTTMMAAGSYFFKCFIDNTVKLGAFIVR